MGKLRSKVPKTFKMCKILYTFLSYLNVCEAIGKGEKYDKNNIFKFPLQFFQL